jgi:periplasmic divalent cation tolerance protein
MDTGAGSWALDPRFWALAREIRVRSDHRPEPILFSDTSRRLIHPGTLVQQELRKPMNQQDKVLIVLTTCPAQAVADQIAQTLVGEHLAACVNQIPGIRSIYMWKGQVQTDAEVQLVIKTTERGFESLKARLAALHPYELPELIGIPVCAGSEKYLAWVRDTVKSS